MNVCKMVSSYFTEDQCSHMFFHQVAQFYDVFQYRVHGTPIEHEEGVDVVYIVDLLEKYDIMKKNAKVVLVQEKAPYPPPYSFYLEKNQHDTLLNRQRLFNRWSYFYAFFSVKTMAEFCHILSRTIFFPVSPISAFSTSTKTIKTTSGFRVIFTSQKRRHNRRGYPFSEFLVRLMHCNFGISRVGFPDLIEQLYVLWEAKIPVYFVIYDKDEERTEFLRMKKKGQKDENESSRY